MSERLVLKENQTFLVTNRFGDVRSRDGDGQGLYHRDTRFLSVYELLIGDALPQLLSSVGEFNFMTTLQYANPPMQDHDGQLLAARSLSFRRNRFLRDGLHERIGMLNYNPFSVRLCLRLLVGADFRDMFDVRGYATRGARGVLGDPELNGDRVRLSYLGLDGVARWTELLFDPAPDEAEIVPMLPDQDGAAHLAEGISGHGDVRVEVPIVAPRAELRFLMVVPPKQFRSLTIRITPHIAGTREPNAPPLMTLDRQFVAVRDAFRAWDDGGTRIDTDHETLNAMVQQASHDLRMLVDDTADGFVPSAGIPWFAVPFGRDSLIVGAQTLSLQPALAEGALRFLARRQGTQVNAWRDEEPGKILHEVRTGEMASLAEVPHAAYYGSVDSTPLFLMLLGELLDWTADLDFARQMLPHAEAALEWIDRYGDLDGDGFVEYQSRSERGIKNQGWKDSRDSVRYRDGGEVTPPIALVEVQGYVYAARVRMAALFERLGFVDRAATLRGQAESLRERFEQAFWMESDGYYALALDAQKRQAGTVASNPGHCLWSGLLRGERALAVGRRLVADDLLCGWGIRTLSTQESGFNPMSYHNGSVWPHDNALIAAGLKAAGMDREATDVVSQVLEAGLRMPGLRLPELYCGFGRDRRYHSLPAQYPVSCSPQAWAAGSIFLLLQTLLGLRVDAWRDQVKLRPLLPTWLQRITLRHLRVGKRVIHLNVRREQGKLRVDTEGDPAIQVTVEEPRWPAARI